MKKYILVSISVLIILTGCSKKYTEEEYSTVVSELNAVKAEMDIFKVSLQETEKKLQDTENNLSKAEKDYKEYLQLYTDLYGKTIKGALFESWAQTAFGEDNVTCSFSSNGYFNCIVDTDYSDNLTMSKLMYNDLLESMSTLGIIAMTDTNINTVSVTFTDSNKKETTTYVFRKENGIFALKVILGDLERSSYISHGLSN